ncbi:MAG: MauE/DoxX family redox-associated membrane protein [Burkholderiales bacterium]|jgi:hypothetical protein
MPATDPLIHAVVTAALVVLWGHAAVVKLRDRERLEGVVAGYRLLPAALAPTVSRVLPAVELALAAGLVGSATRGVAALASAALLAVYGAAVAINLVRGRRAIDCGCGGRPRPIHPWLVGRNVVLAAVSASLVVPVAPRELGPLDAVNAAMMLAAAIGLYATLEQWLHNRQALVGAAGSREG